MAMLPSMLSSFQNATAASLGLGSSSSVTFNDITVSKTITTPGTTGAQTINKAAGRVNAAIAATSLVVTNSLVTANSIVIVKPASNDATGRIISVVPASGSFTIYFVAPAAEMAIDFLVIN